MERKTYLGRYQVGIDERGEPIELDRGASSVTVKAEDTTSGEPVVVEVVRPGPMQHVPMAEVEADARAAQQLDHINIARLRDFGFDDGDLVYVREFLEGSTLDTWVREHGPLPVAAVMRIALQGVNALAAAKFQSVAHRSIQPASLMIVPGQTAEGDWPLVKILNFGALAPTFSRSGFTTTGPGEMAQFASPEQLQGAKPDFKSDIYSLGATLWFLLTGAAPRAGMLERSRGIPKNVAAVISRMLAANPDHRPIDPLVLQEEIRACLGRAERRDLIGRRFGLPAKVAKPSAAAVAVMPPVLAVAATTEEAAEPEPVEDVPAAVESASVGRFLLRPLAWAAAILTAGAIAAMILPPTVRSVQNWQAQRAENQEKIGVKVGVPEQTADAVASTPVAPAAAVDAAAPDVAPPQDTAVAVSRSTPAPAASPSFPSAGSDDTITQSGPAVAAAPTTKLPDPAPATSSTAQRSSDATTPDAAPAMAYTNNTGAAQSSETAQSVQRAQDSQTQTTAARQQAPVVATNTARPAEQVTEPAAPAEGPDDSLAQAQSEVRQNRATAERDLQAQTDTARSQRAKTASASAEGDRRAARSATNSTTRNRTAARSQQRERDLEVRQALPLTPEDELPPVPRGSKRARYLGTTPDGALVFGMPSSERVFVAPPPPDNSPRRRLRRLPPGADEPPPRAEPLDPEELAELQALEEDEE